MRRRDSHRSREVAVAIDCAKPLSRLGPFGSNPSAAHDSIRFHLEKIGEVAADRNFELKLYWFHAVVGDINVLVHTASDPPADGEAERARRYRVIFRREGAIGKKNSCGVVSDGAAIKQYPGFTICIDGRAADNPSVTEK